MNRWFIKIKCFIFGHDYYFIGVAEADSHRMSVGEVKPFCRRCMTNFPCLKFPENPHQLELYWNLLNKLKRKFGNLALRRW